ncbi:MAG TPA: ATP-grasp domain-containing protein [Kofleriaceae bacterium]|nr:ATP-grasp domain-containing protein [Kofleriaceae bacterium]
MRAAAGLDDVRMLGITKEVPRGGDVEVFADLVTVDDGDDAAQLVAAARVLERRHGRIHRVLGIRESLQVPVGEIRRALGVRGPGPDTAERFRNKARMKDELRRHGLPCARHRLLRSWNDAEALIAESGLPVVVKPLADCNCRGVRRARTIDELRDALSALHASPENPALAEEMLVGREFCFDTITIDGQVRFYSLAQYSPTTLEAVETPGGQWVVVLPRNISGSEWSDAIDLGIRVIAALGLDTGVTHMEWFRRDDGSLAVSEIAARPAAGNHIPLTGWAYDVALIRAWARAVVDDAFDGPYDRRYAVGCAYLRGVGRGRVQRVTGVDRVRELFGPLIVEARLPELGAPSCEDYDGDVSIAVRHPDTEVVLAAMRTITETIAIEYGR